MEAPRGRCARPHRQAQACAVNGRRIFRRLVAKLDVMDIVEGFRKYLIFYIPRDYGIEVVRVLYGPRDLETLFAS
jgi:hypothetical protein